MSNELTDLMKLAGLNASTVSEETINEADPRAGDISISRDLWTDILQALKSADFCDHDQVREVLARIENEVPPMEGDQEEDEVEEAVDHTKYSNEPNSDEYDLSAFDFKGRASLDNRYVQSRYSDNPLKNAEQFTHESQTLEEEFAEFLNETTLKQAQAEARKIGMTLYKEDGEYCVNFKGGKEATKYYTDDLDDALGTAKLMAKNEK